MATTQISDIYEPATFDVEIDEAAIELNAFFLSGIVVEDAVITEQAMAGGRIGLVTGFTPLANDEPNISSDDPAVLSVAKKIGSAEQQWRIAALNQSWSTMNLSRELALKDPATAVISKVGQYWATAQEQRVIRSNLGIMQDNIDTDSSDMTITIGTDAVGAPVAAELVSKDSIIDCKQTMGDHQFIFTAIAMHSVVFTNLYKQQDIVTEYDSETKLPYPTYLQMRVVLDDTMPAVAGVNRVMYTTILFGPGAMGHGKGRVIKPTQVKDNPDAGNGGGEEIIYSRTSDAYHMYGVSFTNTTVVDESPTLAELALPANWNRVYARKNVPVAYLRSNG